MRKEPWLLKNAFWIMATSCGFLAFFSDFKGKIVSSILFGIVCIFSLIVGLYYFTLPTYSSLEDNYEKATRHQRERKKLKVIKGGK